MKYPILVALTLFYTFLSFGQNTSVSAYAGLAQQADSLYLRKAYRQAANKYSEAFQSNGWKGSSIDRYNAACSWALVGESDSAFFQLTRIVTKLNYGNYKQITTDPDLLSLHEDARWAPLLEMIQQNGMHVEGESHHTGPNFNPALAAELDSILQDDQSYRLMSGKMERRYGWHSEEMKAHLRKIEQIDSLHLIRIKAILDTYGWLGPDVVGDMGSTTLFLVIQHSDLPTQEKYMPMLREAVKAGKALPGDLALMEDRVALSQGKRQIYGSQIGRNQKTLKFFVSPLNDPDHVDQRRAEVRLRPLAEYVTRWQIQWDPEQYKKDLPKLEKLVKKQKKQALKNERKSSQKH